MNDLHHHNQDERAPARSFFAFVRKGWRVVNRIIFLATVAVVWLFLWFLYQSDATDLELLTLNDLQALSSMSIQLALILSLATTVLELAISAVSETTA